MFRPLHIRTSLVCWTEDWQSSQHKDIAARDDAVSRSIENLDAAHRTCHTVAEKRARASAGSTHDVR